MVKVVGSYVTTKLADEGDNLKSLFGEESSCQVCWRKIEMAMGLSHALET